MLRLSFLLILILGASPVLADPPAAEFKNGHWQPITPVAVVPTVVNDPQLAQLLSVGDSKAALNVGIDWIKSHSKTAPLRDKALYLIARAKFQLDGGDDWMNAYYYCDELMDEYPESKLFYDALQLQFTIADGFIAGHPDKFLGLPVVPRQEQAVEMLYRIQERSPGSPLAEKALLRTCDYYYSTGEYELAHDAYGFYMKTYPRSTMMAQVKLRQAFSSLAQFHGVRFDPTCLLDARAELLDVIAAYPSMAKEKDLSAIVARIDQTLARKLLVTADFYRRTSAPRGAVYVYRYLIDVYPDSDEAAEAKKALAGMPASALKDLPPKAGEAFSVPLGPAK
jgi:outer membrane assembly lipoprotein YfiO